MTKRYYELCFYGYENDLEDESKADPRETSYCVISDTALTKKQALDELSLQDKSEEYNLKRHCTAVREISEQEAKSNYDIE